MARLEPARQPANADAAIRAMANALGTLPAPARRLWNTATRRDFDVGIQAGTEPHDHATLLTPATIQSVAALKGQITVTIYAAETTGPARSRKEVRGDLRNGSSATKRPRTRRR